jgi:hypothetical protein
MMEQHTSSVFTKGLSIPLSCRKRRTALNTMTKRMTFSLRKKPLRVFNIGFSGLYRNKVVRVLPARPTNIAKLFVLSYSNAAMFHDRRHSWLRKHQRPRILMQILFFFVILLAMGVVCMHFLRLNQALARENRQLKEQNKQLEFEMQRILHTPDQ